MGTLVLCCAALSIGQSNDMQPELALDTGGHTARAQRVFVINDDRTILTAGYDGCIRLWDVTTGECFRTLRISPQVMRGIYSASLSADEKHFAVSGPTENVTVVSLESFKVESVFTAHAGHNVPALAFSPDGKSLLTGSNDRTVREWAWSTGELLQTSTAHSQHIQDLAFSRDGNVFASASADGSCKISNRRMQVITSVTRPGAEARCVTFLGDSQRFAVGWSDGAVTAHVENGNTLASAEHAGHFIHEVQSDARGSRILFTSGWNPDGSGPLCGIVYLDFATAERRFTQHTNLTTAAAFFQDDERVVTLGGDSNEAIVWYADSGRTVQKMMGRGRAVWSAAWSPDGSTIAWGNANVGSSIHANSPIERAFDISKLEWRHIRSESEINAGDVIRVVYEGAPVQVDGRLIAKLTMGDQLSVQQIRNGWFWVSVGGSAGWLRSSHVVRASDHRFQRARFQVGPTSLRYSGYTTVDVLRNNQHFTTLQFESEYERMSNGVRSFTLISDDRAAVGSDYGLYLFDTRTASVLRRYQSQQSAIWGVSPSPDGHHLLSASSDMTLCIWNPDVDYPLLSFFFADQDWIAWTPEGYYACSSGGENLMGWQVDNGPAELASFYAASRFRKTFYRPDVIQRLLEAGSTEEALRQADEARGRITQQTSVSNILPPIIEIVRPSESRVQLDQPALTVTAKAKARGEHRVASMTLLINGRPYDGLKGTRSIVREQDTDAEVTESWTLELPMGEHQIQVRASTSQSNATSSPLQVVYEPDMPLRPTLYVLAVGVSKYENLTEQQQLRFAAKDADTVGKEFTEHASDLFANVESTILLDEDATQRSILKSLKALQAKMTQRDVAVVYLSGHGVRDETGAFYFFPSDGEADELFLTGVAESQIKQVFKSTPGRVILMLDVCHGGAFGGERRKSLGGIADDMVRDLVTDDYGLIVMASSMGNEVSMEHDDWGHGAFTKAFSEGLHGKADYNDDGVIYLHEVDGYITDRVKELTNGRQHPSTTRPNTIRSFPLGQSKQLP